MLMRHWTCCSVEGEERLYCHTSPLRWRDNCNRDHAAPSVAAADARPLPISEGRGYLVARGSRVADNFVHRCPPRSRPRGSLPVVWPGRMKLSLRNPRRHLGALQNWALWMIEDPAEKRGELVAEGEAERLLFSQRFPEETNLKASLLEIVVKNRYSSR